MTELDPWQVRLGDSGLLLDPDNGYRVSQILGLDREIRSADDDRANSDGAVLGPDYGEAKNILISLTIEGDGWDPDDAMAKYDALAADWSSTRLTEGRQSTADLRFRLPGRATQRFIGGRPRRLSADFSSLTLGWLEVLASYYAPDPRLVSDVQHVIDLVYNDTATVLPNAGNWPAAVVWDVNGAVTNPGVIRSETVRFDLAATIANGTYYRVRTDPRTVTKSSDSSNQYPTISGLPTGQVPFLEVPASGASFRAVGTSPGSGKYVRATYRDTWM